MQNLSAGVQNGRFALVAGGEDENGDRVAGSRLVEISPFPRASTFSRNIYSPDTHGQDCPTSGSFVRLVASGEIGQVVLALRDKFFVRVCEVIDAAFPSAASMLIRVSRTERSWDRKHIEQMFVTHYCPVWIGDFCGTDCVVQANRVVHSCSPDYLVFPFYRRHVLLQ
eukprot:TRINITY_DN4513_c0_g1_i1.p3 TRINITY_DN4513_c0_g1~~TRINITY_DN4513_c0_g1_i1.p3  ORF type:complete len:168 (-),score=16.76 TRINITY_DN4513_c0_g1_i1:46-549(-)